MPRAYVSKRYGGRERDEGGNGGVMPRDEGGSGGVMLLESCCVGGGVVAEVEGAVEELETEGWVDILVRLSSLDNQAHFYFLPRPPSFLPFPPLLSPPLPSPPLPFPPFHSPPSLSPSPLPSPLLSLFFLHPALTPMHGYSYSVCVDRLQMCESMDPLLWPRHFCAHALISYDHL